MFRQIMTNWNTPNNVSETRWILTVAKPISWWNCVLCHPHVSKEPLERASFVTVSPHHCPYHSVCHMASMVNLQLWTQSSKRSRELWVKSPPNPPLSPRILYSKAVKKRCIPWLPGNLNRVKNDVKTPGLPRVFLNGWGRGGGGRCGGLKWLVHN